MYVGGQSLEIVLDCEEPGDRGRQNGAVRVPVLGFKRKYCLYIEGCEGGAAGVFETRELMMLNIASTLCEHLEPLGLGSWDGHVTPLHSLIYG